MKPSNQKAEEKYRFSIIVPVLGEVDQINSLIEHLYNQHYGGNCEIIVVDGDPNGGTVTSIQRNEVISIVSSTGRSWQMNAGAAIARGEILVFLHADTRLPAGALDRISHALEQKRIVGGAFSLGISSPRLVFKIIAHLASLRSRLTRIPYGDQAIFVRRDYFNEIGGYREIPLMEDVELMQRIQKLGDRIGILPHRVSTSPRRWEKEGIVYCTLRNWVISILYFIGVSPDRLSSFYRSYHSTDN